MRIVEASPAAEPVTPAELRSHARLDDLGVDADLARFIAAARQWVERSTGRALINRSVTVTVDHGGGKIALPRLPAAAPSSVTLDGVAISPTPALDALDRIEVQRAGSVVVIYVAGYGASATDVPAALRDAVLRLATALQEDRGDSSDPDTLARSLGLKALIGAYQVAVL